VHSTEALPRLAAAIEDAVAKVGVPKEKRPYQPHLTFAKAGQAKGAHQSLKQLIQKLDPEEHPHFGTMTAREFFLYRSEIMRGGARYTKLERFPLT
jgi:2'-5' RNA ligase